MAGGFAAVAVGQVRPAKARSLAHSRHPGVGGIPNGVAAFKVLLTFPAPMEFERSE